MKKHHPKAPLGLSFKQGDLVELKHDDDGRRAGKIGADAARRRGHIVWRVVGIQVVYGQSTMLRLESVTPGEPLQLVVPLHAVRSLSDSRPPCKVVRHNGGTPAVASWPVAHPRFGDVLAVRAPLYADYVRRFQRVIPAHARHWDPRTRLWYVHPRYRIILGALLRTYFPDGSKMPNTSRGVPRKVEQAEAEAKKEEMTERETA